MTLLIATLYRLALLLYQALIYLLAPVNSRASEWLKGRKKLFSLIENSLSKAPDSQHRVWFHFASLGEFEQGKPVMEKLKEERPDTFLIITFFSPSGYKLRSNYALADRVFYLPMDSPANARRLLNLFKPSLVIFVKYEFWYYYLREAFKRQVPVLLLSAVFRPQQLFFKPFIGTFFKRMLQGFRHIFVQDESSLKLAASLDLHNVSLSRDTRFDRVWQTLSKSEVLPDIERFKNAELLLVAGSSWPVEERMLATWLPGKKNIKLLIAPHDVSESHVSQIRALFPEAVLYSQSERSNFAEARVLIVDHIGLLASLYRYADMAFVGGAFGKGLHNILEAAAFGMPIVFGPNTGKFPEAAALQAAGGAFSVNNNTELNTLLDEWLMNAPKRLKAAEASRNYVSTNRGATQLVIDFLTREKLF